MKATIESEWEELLAEIRKAHEYGVPGIGSREITDVERKLQSIRRKRENMPRLARILLDYLGRGKSRLPRTNNP